MVVLLTSLATSRVAGMDSNYGIIMASTFSTTALGKYLKYKDIAYEIKKHATDFSGVTIENIKLNKCIIYSKLTLVMADD